MLQSGSDVERRRDAGASLWTFLWREAGSARSRGAWSRQYRAVRPGGFFGAGALADERATITRRAADVVLPVVASVPFASYYENAEFKALSDATVKLAMSAPIGVPVQLLLGSASPRRQRALRIAAMSTGALAFTVVEAGQVLLPSRFPDSTDILLGVAGLWVGMKIAGWLQNTKGSA